MLGSNFRPSWALQILSQHQNPSGFLPMKKQRERLDWRVTSTQHGIACDYLNSQAKGRAKHVRILQLIFQPWCFRCYVSLRGWLVKVSWPLKSDTPRKCFFSGWVLTLKGIPCMVLPWLRHEFNWIYGPGTSAETGRTAKRLSACCQFSTFSPRECVEKLKRRVAPYGGTSWNHAVVNCKYLKYVLVYINIYIYTCICIYNIYIHIYIHICT